MQHFVSHEREGRLLDQSKDRLIVKVLQGGGEGLIGQVVVGQTDQTLLPKAVVVALAVAPYQPLHLFDVHLYAQDRVHAYVKVHVFLTLDVPVVNHLLQRFLERLARPQPRMEYRQQKFIVVL